MDTQSKPLVEDRLWTQLNNAVSLRSAEDQVLWTIFGAFWGVDAILLVALFTTGKLPDPIVGLFVSVVGVLLSVAWNTIINRTILHLERFEKLIERLEAKLDFDTDFAISLKLNLRDAENFFGRHNFPVRKVMRWCSVAFILLWGISLVYFIWSITVPYCY